MLLCDPVLLVQFGNCTRSTCRKPIRANDFEYWFCIPTYSLTLHDSKPKCKVASVPKVFICFFSISDQEYKIQNRFDRTAWCHIPCELRFTLQVIQVEKTRTNTAGRRDPSPKHPYLLQKHHLHFFSFPQACNSTNTPYAGAPISFEMCNQTWYGLKNAWRQSRAMHSRTNDALSCVIYSFSFSSSHVKYRTPTFDYGHIYCLDWLKGQYSWEWGGVGWCMGGEYLALFSYVYVLQCMYRAR